MNIGLIIFICCEVIGVAIIHIGGWQDKPDMSGAAKWKFTLILSLCLLLEAVGLMYYIND